MNDFIEYLSIIGAILALVGALFSVFSLKNTIETEKEIKRTIATSKDITLNRLLKKLQDDLNNGIVDDKNLINIFEIVIKESDSLKANNIVKLEHNIERASLVGKLYFVYRLLKDYSNITPKQKKFA